MNFATKSSSIYKSGRLFWKNLNVENCITIRNMGLFYWMICLFCGSAEQSTRNLNCISLIKFTVLLYDYFSRSQWHIRLGMLQQL